jgi:hypothetical protein
MHPKAARRTAPKLALALTILYLSVAAPAAAREASLSGGFPATLDLGLDNFGDARVDPVTGLLVVSEGEGFDSLVTVSPAGSIGTRLDALQGPGSMTIIGSTLFVVMRGADRIDRFSLPDLTPLGSVDTDGREAIREVATVAGRLWFSHDSCATFCISWMTDDLSTVSDLELEFDPYFLRTSPSGSPIAQSRLFVTGGWPNSIAVIDAASVPPTVEVSKAIPNLPFAVSPDEQRMLALTVEYETDRLTTTGVGYVTETGVSSVAWSPTGDHVVIGRGSNNNPDVYVFTPGDPDATAKWGFRTAGMSTKELWDHGLLFSADGGTLFAFTGDTANEVLLRALNPDARSTSLTLTASDTVIGYKDTTTMTATLTGAGGAPNRTVKIFKVKPNGTRTLAKSGVVGFTGKLVWTSPALTQITNLIAEYAGDDGHLPSKSKKVQIGVGVDITGALSGNSGTSGIYKLYPAGTFAPYTTTVVPNKAGKTVHVVLQQKDGSIWKEVDDLYVKLTAASTKRVFVTGPAGALLRVHVTFEPDGVNWPTTSTWSFLKMTSGTSARARSGAGVEAAEAAGALLEVPDRLEQMLP